MQSDFTDSPTTPLDDPFAQHNSLEQHGFHSSNNIHGLSRDSSDERSERSASSYNNQPLEGQGISPDKMEYLYHTDEQPRVLTDRVTQYENALQQLPKAAHKSKGPAFVVVPSPDGECSENVVENLPNEILIMILSHLPARAMSSVSQVSKRFHALVTTPYAWRIAFARYFPGQDATDDRMTTTTSGPGPDTEARDDIRAEQRYFARLTDIASWRDEYILRTKLLRCLARGKPQQPSKSQVSARSNAQSVIPAIITYNSQLFTTINHIDGKFGGKDWKPHFIHGSDESGYASVSDLKKGEVVSWISQTMQAQFAEMYYGEAPFGMGEGALIGVPNVMDVSDAFGYLYGAGIPGGQVYFRSYGEHRGRYLAKIGEYSEYPPYLPRVPNASDSVTAVWIAKSAAILSMTGGLMGIVTGLSSGVVTAYSLGINTAGWSTVTGGEMTCRWVLSPGVPIIAIKMDDAFSEARKASGRIWGVALNALGEVYYLKDVVQRSGSAPPLPLVEEDLSIKAWATAQSAAWVLVESSRRTAKHHPYKDRSGWACTPPPFPPSCRLSEQQDLQAQCREIEEFCSHIPAYFRNTCNTWDMRRRLQVDFGGDGENVAGENIVVIGSNSIGAESPQILRYTRVKTLDLAAKSAPDTPLVVNTPSLEASIFGDVDVDTPPATSIGNPSSQADLPKKLQPIECTPNYSDDWKISSLTWDGPATLDITADAIDMSKYSTLTIEEDDEAKDGVPGHRARYLAVGTKTGSVYVWNMRGSLSTKLSPLRVISTTSPQISCLAVSSLYLVHGGNDGLVQAWDVLASSLDPVRTLHSRFSTRARRRLIQAEASAQGVGINLFAAGAIALDPDPTSLRGVVSLGTHLRYWAYSSSNEDSSGKKRRLRRGSIRGSNGASDYCTGHRALDDYIANEQREFRREKREREEENMRLQGRFGVGLAEMSEEEALQYAEMISQEAFEKDEERKLMETPSGDFGGTPTFSPAVGSPSPGSSSVSQPNTQCEKTDEELASEIKEAIRLSLLASNESAVDNDYLPPSRSTGSSDYNVPFTVKARKGRNKNSRSPEIYSSDAKGKGKAKEGEIAVDDLEHALQLSVAEEQSRQESKGKGRADSG